MASNFSNDAELLVLDWINGVGTPTRPTTPLKLALYTADPGEAPSTTNEVTGGSYARQNVTIGAATGTAPATASNTNQVDFLNMPAVTVTHMVIWNNGGTVAIWSGPLAANKVVNAGDTFTVAAGDLDLEVS